MKSFCLASLAALACIVAGCSANSDDNKSFGNGVGGTAGSGGMPTGGSGGTELDAQPPIDTDSGPDDAYAPPDGETCDVQSVAAEPYPLDMYVMLDQSGSMSAQIGLSGKTQWKAAVEAFTRFLENTPTQGLSMGIQYFPLPVTPWSQMTSCGQDASVCGAGGVCLEVDTGTYCHATCTTNADCDPASECRSDFCSNDRCDDASYATPAIEIGEIPAVNADIIASLNEHGPQTFTPTAPALRGAVSHAREWATAHPDHTTIVVLATDGMPTVCPASGGDLVKAVKDAAQAGVSGTPSVRTFVIGVVTPGDFIAVNNLNAFAAAGGTGKATIVSPNADMTTELAKAFEAIRGAAMPCEFHVPDNPSIDFGKVNVVYTNTSQEEFTVYYVGDASQCDPTLGGWYYDTDPTQTDPSTIILCPESCSFIQSYGGRIDIEMGCETETPPLK